MTKITAIELENFQSIERRTRIELRPITLLYGPNSAGKSSVFDAFELLQVLLDPAKFDQKKAADMVDRWARKPGNDQYRETTLAVEFPFDLGESWDPIGDLWRKSDNWAEGEVPTESPHFWFDGENEDFRARVDGKIVRIELTLKVIHRDTERHCFVSEFTIYLDDVLIAKLEKDKSAESEKDPEHLRLTESKDDSQLRWLTLDNTLEFIDPALTVRLVQLKDDSSSANFFTKVEDNYRIQQWVKSASLSPRKLIPDTFFGGAHIQGEREIVCSNVADIFFYFGAMLWSPLRDSPSLVHSDRRAPKPEEALTVVDLGLRGWWDESSFSPSSPAILLKSYARPLDEHYQDLAEVAHAELLLRTVKHDFWGGSHAAKHIAPVKSRAKVLDRVNHHLEQSLFTEKLYRLTCASTLMVPIDLREDDPWSYYALAQPAAVRLFLQDSTGQKVDLHDVGSGVPFVLPVLYAVSAQGFVGVQQPELHLHPALQSSLADVFIEELHREGCGQFVIETHSEHFLLRLLRRIRDTEKNKSLSEELKLTNDQIAVYYFDPQVGGGTFVSRQLVTPLGDFYNDWPRGFFSERNDDLFDE